ncbi:olfactory receptor 5M11-like [Bufo gargarizans]|uniref:olfactory receptor 5M11-like n=1 Tax=Bufo gargarizans TaxID=30331 RepID=UPI001CF0EDAF|nr:olfactory receptor 5M11-like [Bufo gargarizans]
MAAASSSQENGGGQNMEERNQTWVDFFVLKGISDLPQMQTSIFFLVLITYLTILSGNVAILLLICHDRQLHTPMYYFLSHLSILDICYSTVTMHKTLAIYVFGDKSVSFHSCIAQMYFYVALLCCEFFMLTAMSYDRYVAVCNPLHYVMIMNSKVCSVLSTVSLVLGFCGGVPVTLVTYDIRCFISNEINHFFCDLLVIMKLLCYKAFNMEHVIYIESIFVGVLPFSLTLTSYVFIIRTILQIHSSSGRYKTFYTCSSHITVVSLLYVTLFCLYLKPTSSVTLESEKVLMLFYTALTPMLNPVIYSLKNKDIKMAFRRVMMMNNKILL